MGEDVRKINNLEELFPNDASLLTSDEDIALHVMHRFNIDMDTIESLPAFNEPLRKIFWPDKK